MHEVPELPARSTIASTSSASSVPGGHQPRRRLAHARRVARRASRSAPAIDARGSPRRARSARVSGNGSVEPIMLMRSPGAPWSGWRRFQPVKVASGAAARRAGARRLVAVRVHRRDEASRYGAPTFGGSADDDAVLHVGPEVERGGPGDAIGKPHAGDGREDRRASTPRAPRCRRRAGGPRSAAARRPRSPSGPGSRAPRAAAARSRPR